VNWPEHAFSAARTCGHQLRRLLGSAAILSISHAFNHDNKQRVPFAAVIGLQDPHRSLIRYAWVQEELQLFAAEFSLCLSAAVTGPFEPCEPPPDFCAWRIWSPPF
jgi:hypothetical protein